MTETYERLIKKEVRGRLLFAKVALVCAYSLWATVGTLLVMRKAQMNIYLLALVLLLDVLFIALTWKRTYVEYEYLFTNEYFELAKIYGKAQRKELLCADLLRATLIAPYTDEYTQRIGEKQINKTYEAISQKQASDVWFMLFEEENGERTLVVFEADEESLKILRHASPRATVKNGYAK